MRRGVVAQVSPLTVQIEGSAAVAALAVPGAVYTVGQAVVVYAQEPGVGLAYPMTSTPTPGLKTQVAAVSYANSGTDADAAGGHVTLLSRLGRQGLLSVNATLGADLVQGATALTLSAGFEGVGGAGSNGDPRQQGTLMVKMALNANLTGFGEFYVQGNALVFYQWVPTGQGVSGLIPAGYTIHGTLPYLTA
jgi:hypothetical protein